MHLTYLFRAVIFLTLVFAAFTAPWWITIPIAIFCITIFHAYELISIGILLDSMYPQELFVVHGTGYVFTIALLLSVSASWILTKEVRGLA